MGGGRGPLVFSYVSYDFLIFSYETVRKEDKLMKNNIFFINLNVGLDSGQGDLPFKFHPEDGQKTGWKTTQKPSKNIPETPTEENRSEKSHKIVEQHRKII